MAELIITNRSELKAALKEIAVELRDEEKKATLSDRLYSKNQVCKKLKIAWKTVDNLCNKGLLKTTASGLISEEAINNYLQRT